MAAPQYQGFYINLDRSVERRAHVENQLAAYKLQSRYACFPACVGNALNLQAPKLSPGAIGCFSSHYLLLKSQIQAPTHIHVTEDDVVFSPAIAALMDSLLTQGVLNDYDMLYTDVFVPIDFSHLQDLAVRFRQSTTLNEDGTVKATTNLSVLPLKNRVFACTSSYFVNKNSIGKMAALLEKAAQSEIPAPIDLFYRQKTYEGSIAAGCLFPFITTVDTRHSQSSDVSPSARKNREASQLALTLLRNLFYVHSKPRELLAACESQLIRDPMDDRDKVLAAVCRFALSQGYEVF